MAGYLNKIEDNIWSRGGLLSRIQEGMQRVRKAKVLPAKR